MRLDSAILEDLMDRARLSTRERETMRLECAGSNSNDELAAALGCGVASVKTYRRRGRQKLLRAQAVYEAEQRGREVEDLDEADLCQDLGVERFLLQAIIPPHHSDHGPHISLTYTEYDLNLRREFVVSEDAAVHCGALVTPYDVARAPRRRPMGPNPYGRDTD
jgi:hypothetical protein